MWEPWEGLKELSASQTFAFGGNLLRNIPRITRRGSPSEGEHSYDLTRSLPVDHPRPLIWQPFNSQSGHRVNHMAVSESVPWCIFNRQGDATEGLAHHRCIQVPISPRCLRVLIDILHICGYEHKVAFPCERPMGLSKKCNDNILSFYHAKLGRG